MDKVLRLFLWIALVGLALFAGWLFVQSRGMPDAVADLSDRAAEPTATIYASSETIIESVQALSRLETASYHIEKVITAETGQGPLGFLFGDRLLLIAFGQVIAGIDLAEVGAADVLTTSDGVVYLRLPPVRIFVATLDNERTSVYDRRTGVMGLNPQLETDARQEAERLIREAAIEEGIEATAADNARAFLSSFLIGLGFKQVIFVDVMPTPTPAAATPAP